MDLHTLKTTAEQYFKSGQLPESLEAYTRLCDLKPQNAQAWHMRAAIHGMLGQFQDTVLCCEQALSINPGAVSVYKNYASALVELKRYEEAIEALQRAIQLDPADATKLNTLGHIFSITEKFTAAEACFRKILERDPGSAETASHLAHTLKESGDITGAIEICEQALLLNPANRALTMANIEYCFLQGSTDKARQCINSAKPLIVNISTALYRICKILHGNKQYSEAANALQVILTIFPEDDYFKLLLADCQIKQQLKLQALATLEQLSDNNLTLAAQILFADICRNTGQAEKAEHQLIDTVKQFPNEENPVALLARSRVTARKYEQASSLLEHYLQRHPDSHKILVELGSLNELTENQTKAEKLYIQAITIKPTYAIAYSRLGVLYQNDQRYALACDYFKQAIHHDPALLLARCSLAYLHCSQGEYTAALNQYETILAIEPDFEAAIAGKATILERVGELETAFRLVEPLAESATDNIHTLLAYAHTCSIAGKELTAASLLERALEQPGILPNDRMHACFMLGKLLDKLGKFDQAFLSYQHGNALNRFPFDRDAHQRLIDAVMSVFSHDNMKTFPTSTNRTDKLVFIVGMPRSGTTLTEQILASHPEVFGAGELSHIRHLAATLHTATNAQQTFPLCMPGIDQTLLDKRSFEHLRALESLADGQAFITDKMPSNFMFLGLIEKLFPNARILHCQRDPLDTCLSCYFQNFSRGQYFSYQQADLGFYYNQYQQLMAHWKSTLSIPIMDIQYEHMVANQENTSKKMMAFIGLEWHPDCLDFHKSRRKIRTASYDQVRKPVYSSSVKRWEKYANHLTELQNALK